MSFFLRKFAFFEIEIGPERKLESQPQRDEKKGPKSKNSKKEEKKSKKKAKRNTMEEEKSPSLSKAESIENEKIDEEFENALQAIVHFQKKFCNFDRITRLKSLSSLKKMMIWTNILEFKEICVYFCVHIFFYGIE